MLPETVRAALAERFGGSPVGRVEPAARARLSGAAHVLVGDTRVFAKWPAASARVRRAARAAGAYRREVLFYRELATGCPVRVPRAYACRHDEVTGDFVLLLEDVAARPGDTLGGDAGDVARVLRAVAALHGASRRLEGLAAPVDPRVLRYALARAAASGRFRRDPARAVLAVLDGGLPEPADRPTLVHGDLHLDQALFPDRGEPVLVDWQLVRPGTAGEDIARLVTLSLDPAERRGCEADLLAAYRRARGDPGYDAAACLADFRRGIVWTAFVNLTAALSAAGEAAGFHDVLFDRIAAAAADHGLLSRSRAPRAARR